MNRMLTAIVGIGALLAAQAHGQSADALTVLTTVGYRQRTTEPLSEF